MSLYRSRKAVQAFSIVDICQVASNGSERGALANAVDLAQRAERLGYRRYWLAEHHGSGNIASQAPEIVIAHVAGHTRTIRVGSGAVLLNHYSPYKVAEQFRTLHAIYPDRIDLGIGRAFAGPVADIALRRHRGEPRVDDYAQQLVELLAWLTHAMPPDHPFASLEVLPGVAGWPQPWLLGSSQSSPALAGQLGLPFAFAGFLSPGESTDALAAYRRAFRQSSLPLGEQVPRTMLSVHVVCAETTREAERLAMSVRHMYASLMRGERLKRLATPAEAIDAFGGVLPADNEAWPRFVVGDPNRVKAVLGRMIDESQPDEIMIQDLITEHDARIRSYELLADTFAIAASIGTAPVDAKMGAA